MKSLITSRDEVDTWFMRYFNTFIDIGAGKIDSREILLYWGVPLHMSNPQRVSWLMSPDAVVGVLNEMQGTLKKIGYTHTEALDKEITIYSDNASRVEAIMSRRRDGGAEVDRAAVSFELRRADEGWIIISTTACPTRADNLSEVW